MQGDILKALLLLQSGYLAAGAGAIPGPMKAYGHIADSGLVRAFRLLAMADQVPSAIRQPVIGLFVQKILHLNFPLPVSESRGHPHAGVP